MASLTNGENKQLKALKRLLLFSFMLCAPALSGQTDAMPSWFSRDLQRNASWLPTEIKRFGIETAYARRWNAFPRDIQVILREMAIPAWMAALVPSTPGRQEEIYSQFRVMTNLAGARAISPIANRIEQLLIFAGAAQLPTPGDELTGKNLGAEGCTAAMTKYILAEIKLEFPGVLPGLTEAMTTSQSSVELKTLLWQAAAQDNAGFTIALRSRDYLRWNDVPPGSLMIAEKPSGTHVFGWTRVPTNWGWSTNDRMAVGNTGLAKFGANRMILAQEFLTDQPGDAYEFNHNEHGPINSSQVNYDHGYPNLEDPRTNVYAVRGSRFIIISFGK